MEFLDWGYSEEGDRLLNYGIEGKTYDIGNRFEWLKTSIEFAMDDEESEVSNAGTSKALYQ